MTPIELLRAYINGDICDDEDCTGCGRISIHSQEGDVEIALDTIETTLHQAHIRIKELEETLGGILQDYDRRMSTKRGKFQIWLARTTSPKTNKG